MMMMDDGFLFFARSSPTHVSTTVACSHMAGDAVSNRKSTRRVWPLNDSQVYHDFGG